MIPKLVCRKCGAEIERSDAFCGACGEKIEWKDAAKPGKENVAALARSAAKSICKLCGHANAENAASCSGCGASLRNPQRDGLRKNDAGKKTQSSPGTPLSFLQSWKVTASLGILLVGTLIFVKLNRQDSPAAGGMPPQHEGMVKEIQALQKSVDDDPKNADAMLKLGNIYYDQRIFPRAIMMYERYLELNASDPNARVDLGVSYFELALQDSLRRDEYFASAKKEMERALTYAPKHQLAYFNLGMVNLHTGDLEKATEWFTRCYAVDSTSETGKRAQQLIKKHITAVPTL